jgi:hypothetical protein
MVAWTFFSVFLAIYSEMSAMVALLLIGLLVASELTDTLQANKARARFAMFIYPGLVLFALIVADKVLKILAETNP